MVVRTTQPFVTMVPEILSPDLKRLFHEADNTPTLVPTLKMCGGIFPFPHTFSWYNALFRAGLSFVSSNSGNHCGSIHPITDATRKLNPDRTLPSAVLSGRQVSNETERSVRHYAQCSDPTLIAVSPRAFFLPCGCF
jgi:hypothetical protein